MTQVSPFKVWPEGHPGMVSVSHKPVVWFRFYPVGQVAGAASQLPLAEFKFVPDGQVGDATHKVSEFAEYPGGHGVAGNSQNPEDGLKDPLEGQDIGVVQPIWLKE